jgi:alkanesulfonate monooxygenase SsuD/methylene tetrahydromethanopterin reductase-like flavin-dependent oxidoreductase (luciferase family)
VWTAEAYGSDSSDAPGLDRRATQRIHLGTAIMQMPARTPAMTAMTAITLDQLSGGRMLLGLGLSGPQVVEGWHGQPYGKPLGKTREYVSIVRAILARQQPLVHQGEYYQIPYRAPMPPGWASRSRASSTGAGSADLPGRDRPQECRTGRRDRRRLAADLLLAQHYDATSAAGGGRLCQGRRRQEL